MKKNNTASLKRNENWEGAGCEVAWHLYLGSEDGGQDCYYLYLI